MPFVDIEMGRGGRQGDTPEWIAMSVHGKDKETSTRITFGPHAAAYLKIGDGDRVKLMLGTDGDKGKLRIEKVTGNTAGYLVRKPEGSLSMRMNTNSIPGRGEPFRTMNVKHELASEAGAHRAIIITLPALHGGPKIVIKAGEDDDGE